MAQYVHTCAVADVHRFSCAKEGYCVYGPLPVLSALSPCEKDKSDRDYPIDFLLELCHYRPHIARQHRRGIVKHEHTEKQKMAKHS